jgi:pyruvate/2-oxoglutarate/acetoin dehydrogenase E1 component
LREISYQQALDEAIAEEMRRDERVVIFGTDFTGDPMKEFGPQRVFITPISEAAMTGIGTGMAAMHFRPVVDWRGVAFALLGMEQLTNSATKLRYMSGGQIDVPVTYRASLISSRTQSTGAQHSLTPYAMYMQIPGLKVLLPSNPADAKGLLKSAIRDNNPVVVFECRELSSLVGPVPDGDHLVPLGVGKVRREGSDVTVVALGYYVPEALAVADHLAEAGVSVEVVDPRSLAPLDTELIRESVRKTGRLVIVDEATPACSVASEIAAVVLEDPSTFEALKAPVERVCGVPVPFPYTPVLSAAALPSKDQIEGAIRQVLSRSGVLA